MSKKQIISVGIFGIITTLGAGIAYYWDPGAINGALGIDSAQIGAGLDADVTMIDASSAPASDLPSENIAIPAPSPQKKTPLTAASVLVPPVATVSDAENGGDGDIGAEIPASSPQDDAPSPSAPCAFPSAAPSTTQKIILNEVAWMGSSSSSVAEWMELKNDSSGTANLAEWELSDTSGKIKISFSGGDVIAPGGFLVLARAGAVPAAGNAPEKIYSGDLANGGDVIAIIDPQCAVSDYLDASHGWPAGDNMTKATMERDDDNAGWHTSAVPGGTPGAKNSTAAPQSSAPQKSIAAATTTVAIQPPPAASPSSAAPAIDGSNDDPVADDNATTTATTTDASDAGSAGTPVGAPPPAATSSGHVLIAAVQIAGASSSNDLVRLYNPTGSAVDMSGWKLHKKSQTGADYSLKAFPTGSAIPVGGSFVWANSEGGFSETVGADVSSTETLSADNSVALLDASGNVIDVVAWGNGTNQYGEGPPYPTDPGAGQMLARSVSGGVMADTGNNMDDFVLQ
ncbi:MAG TPA: lamin tail domain-containing protein [Candidatus Paceibacterota bacterium]|nr:lamin tail domain-containing protein [Candidatus Paceibacterota bacterium]